MSKTYIGFTVKKTKGRVSHTYFHIQTLPKASAADDYWKRCDKRRNCSRRANCFFFIMFSTLFNNNNFIYRDFSTVVRSCNQRRLLQIVCMWGRVPCVHYLNYKLYDSKNPMFELLLVHCNWWTPRYNSHTLTLSLI